MPAYFRNGLRLFSWTLGVLSFWMFATVNWAEARPPNIVLIMADDLGWRDVGYHDSEIKTPHIDRMMQNGVELNRFYVQPSCSPTRASVMTGKSSVRLGVYQPIAKGTVTGLPLDEKVLPEILTGLGYQSLMAGKWHLGHTQRAYLPQERGFEHFYGHVTGGIGYWDHNHGGGHDWQRNGVTVREEGYTTHLIADEVVNLIEGRDRSRPTFLFASFNAPHLPNEAPESSMDGYSEEMQFERRLHAGMVTELDVAIGRILAKLQVEGMSEDTLVWFFSDNGGLNRSANPEGLRSLIDALITVFGTPLPIDGLEFVRKNINEGASDNAPLRAGKTSVYEGGIRVPSVLWAPGYLQPGISDAFVTAQDVLPTLLQAAGLSEGIPEGLDGDTRWQAILSDEVKVPSALPPREFYVQGFDGTALIRGPWKLVLPFSPLPWVNPPPQLYNIYADPSEKRDRAEDFPDRVVSMQATMADWPLGPSIHPSMFRSLMDPDSFGGPEDREPWAERAR